MKKHLSPRETEKRRLQFEKPMGQEAEKKAALHWKSRFSYDSPAPDAARPSMEDKQTLRFDKSQATQAGPDSAKATKATKGKAAGYPHRFRLQFTGEETQQERVVQPDDRPAWKQKTINKKLDKLRDKGEKSENKLYKAIDSLPVDTRPAIHRETDQKSGKSKYKLAYEQRVKKSWQRGRVERLSHYAGQGVSGIRQLVAEGENQENTQDNSNMDTALYGVEKVVSAPGDWLASRRKKKYRRVARRERTAKRKVVKYRYQKELAENTALQQSGFVQKALWKQRIKRQYAAAIREQKRNVNTIVKGATFTTKAARAVALLQAKSKIVIVIALVFVLLIFAFVSCSSVGMMMFGGLFSTTMLSSYAAEDEDIAGADWYFSELEGQLQSEIDMAEQNHPGYDEYQYHLNGTIGHNPFELAAFLNTMYEDFTFVEIQDKIRELFEEIYTLTFEEEIEIKTRIVEDEDGNETEEEYEWYILHVTLDVKDFMEVIQPYLDSRPDGNDQYDLYMDTDGNHQQFGTPLNFYWRDKISCYYGFRDNPTGVETGNELPNGQQMHTGLDIAVATGTPIYSVMEGTVTFADWHDLYGYYVDVTDKAGNKSRYAHCSRLLVSAGMEVKRGQAIAEVGRTGNSTGPHLHLEIFIGGNRVNPLFLVAYGPSSE